MLKKRLNEEWKDIEGFEGKYQISSLGRVKSLEFRNNIITKKREKILRFNYDKKGYPIVALGANKKRYKVSQLVCNAFNWKRPYGLECCHLNGNPEDNRASNLNWVTTRENHLQKKQHGTFQEGSKIGTAKLSENQVKEIKKMIGLGVSNVKIASIYGVEDGAISDIKVGRRWKHV